jgi:putative zinc finger/helix-turn-helix YgiT family protein
MIAEALSDSSVSHCRLCGGNTVVEHAREIMSYLTPKGEVELNVEIPYEVCELCGFRAYGEEGERARTAAIYAYHGRLAPWDIVEVRERLGMTQKGFADLLGVGHASLERWEGGENMQNQSMDNLILLLSSPANKNWLDDQRLRRERTHLRRQAVVPLDRFRVLSEAESIALRARSQKFQLRR